MDWQTENEERKLWSIWTYWSLGPHHCMTWVIHNWTIKKYFWILFLVFYHNSRKKRRKEGNNTFCLLTQTTSAFRPKLHNSIVYRNIYQSITVSEICRDLPLFGYSSLGNSSFPWYSSSWNLSTMEKLWNFLMVLEFYQKIFSNFEGIFLRTQVTQQTQVSQTQILKMWKIHIYYQNNGRLIYISVNSCIWPFWPKEECISRHPTMQYIEVR